MFTRNKTEDSDLNTAIATAYREMAGLMSDTPEYASVVDQLTKLYALKETPSRVSADTLATIAANLAGIGIIVGYEHAHVITSKALAFIMKTK